MCVRLCAEWVDEFGMAGRGVEVSGLVKPGCTVVVFPRARERDEYRGVFLIVPLPAEAADRRLRYDRHRIDAPSVRGLCVRLRIQIVLAARGCSADLPVRYLAVERHSRTNRSDRGRGLLRCAVGDLATSARHHDGSTDRGDRRVGDCAAHRDRGVLLMARGANQELPA